MSSTQSSTSQPAKSPDYSEPLLDSVLLPSDFSEGSITAFHHALKAALVAKSIFTIIHVSDNESTKWTEFPGVRETLERWKLIAPGSSRDAVGELGIDVRKVSARGKSPTKAVLGFLETHPADLIVLAVHHHEGRLAWMRESVAEPVARRAGQMTLFLPDGTPGFVSAANGEVTLDRILIPIALKPSPQAAMAAAARLAVRLGRQRGTFYLLHVGEQGETPVVKPPEVPGWEWKKVSEKGDVIDGIVNTAKRESANLIVMSTDGRNGFLDGLRGSHSERVLHKAPCPLLVVPEGSLAGGALT